VVDRESPAGVADPDAAPLRRNGRRARLLHTLVYLSTLFLAYSGIAVLAEGHPGLARPLGGHVPAATSHRLVGYGLLVVALLVAVVWWRAAGRFFAESLRFGRLDLRWLAGYPRMALTPARQPAPAPHRGHFDPGQRVLNLLLVLALLVLGVTGLIMGMPERFLPSVLGLSLRIHEVATWVLLGLVAGHLLLTSGVLPGYRGVWRAMHLGGRVPAATARRLWPGWSIAPERRRTAQGAGAPLHGAGGPAPRHPQRGDDGHERGRDPDLEDVADPVDPTRVADPDGRGD
jgi:cytochrome b subunit of formate dehydrogenase